MAVFVVQAQAQHSSDLSVYRPAVNHAIMVD